MINVDDYLEKLVNLLKRRFGANLLYVGLQGSYLRCEATETSDIDIMVVLDQLTAEDLTTYRSSIQSLDYADKSCGFICSKTDLLHWNPLEMCHILHTTKDYFGILSELLPEYTDLDIRNFVKLSINNLYHEICHRYIHSEENRDISKLTGSYKSTFFILQNLYYLKHRIFAATKAELLLLLKGKDHAVLERSVELSAGFVLDFDESFDLLLTWCQNTLCSL